jgi:hypothetical protein
MFVVVRVRHRQIVLESPSSVVSCSSGTSAGLEKSGNDGAVLLRCIIVLPTAGPPPPAPPPAIAEAVLSPSGFTRRSRRRSPTAGLGPRRIGRGARGKEAVARVEGEEGGEEKDRRESWGKRGDGGADVRDCCRDRERCYKEKTRVNICSGRLECASPVDANLTYSRQIGKHAKPQTKGTKSLLTRSAKHGGGTSRDTRVNLPATVSVRSLSDSSSAGARPGSKGD